MRTRIACTARRGDITKALAEEIELHRRLLASDATAPSILVERYIAPLTATLQKRYAGRLDPDLVADAVADSLLALPVQPERYDPQKLNLHSYLLMDADGNIRNRIQSEARRLRRLRPIEDVEHSPAARNQSTDDPATAVLDQEGIELPAGLSRDSVLREIAAAFDDPRDLQALELIYEGERRTDVYATLYQLAEHDELARRREVKRIKDRLIKKRDRLVQRMIQRASEEQGNVSAEEDNHVLE